MVVCELVCGTETSVYSSIQLGDLVYTYIRPMLPTLAVSVSVSLYKLCLVDLVYHLPFLYPTRYYFYNLSLTSSTEFPEPTDKDH